MTFPVHSFSVLERSISFRRIICEMLTQLSIIDSTALVSYSLRLRVCLVAFFAVLILFYHEGREARRKRAQSKHSLVLKQSDLAPVGRQGLARHALTFAPRIIIG